MFIMAPLDVANAIVLYDCFVGRTSSNGYIESSSFSSIVSSSNHTLLRLRISFTSYSSVVSSYKQFMGHSISITKKMVTKSPILYDLLVTKNNTMSRLKLCILLFTFKAF